VSTRAFREWRAGAQLFHPLGSDDAAASLSPTMAGLTIGGEQASNHALDRGRAREQIQRQLLMGVQGTRHS
jgi:hypothetical protein